MSAVRKILFGVFCIVTFSFCEELKGYIGVAAGYYEQQDNFEDHSINHTIYSLDTKPKDFSRYLALPSMDLNYYDFYFKTVFKDDFGVQAGYYFADGSSIFVLQNGFGISQEFEEQSFSYKLKQIKDDMYINPYLTNTNRAKKEATTNVLELKVEDIMDFIEIKYKYENINIDDELNNDAKQSGDKHDFSTMAYVIPFASIGFGGFGLYGGLGNFDGDSNDYTKYGYKYAMQMQIAKKHQFQMELATSKYDFDTQNSYFNQIRDEKETLMKLIYMQESFLDRSDLFLNFIFVKQSLDSNIDFFDKDMKAVLFNIGSSF